MGLFRLINRYLNARRFCGEVYGKMVEVRVRSWGRRSIFVDGVLMLDEAIGKIAPDSITVVDSGGVPHRVVIRVVDSSEWAGECRVEVGEEGQPPVQLPEVDRAPFKGKCSR